MSLYLGFDTSNYTTSVALYDSDQDRVWHAKRLLPVKPGEKGIRQSDAVFHHTQQLPELLETVLTDVAEAMHLSRKQLANEIAGIGVSTRPRRVEGSYMPCFTVGMTQAYDIGAVLDLPVREFSHQEGHIAAALYSAGRLDLIGTEFCAFHVSGGTTESLFVAPGTECPVEARLEGTSTDLKAGQAIDRTGVMLGLPFPAGPALEQLALKSEQTYKVRPSANGLDVSLSGVENKCQKMLAEGERPEDIALFCLRSVEAALQSMADALLEQYPGKHLVFSGGVMSNGIIRKDFEARYDCSFAAPEFSADNAAGVAVLASLKK
ncbi:MAG: peptidase M22 [Acutalibacteraceae bacterium]|nr:peptidase M22 [Acutalibacteraceae bacterium]